MKKNNLEVLYARRFFMWDDQGSYEGHALIARDPANNLWIGKSWETFFWAADSTVEWYPIRKICYPRDYVNQIQYYKNNRINTWDAKNGDWIAMTENKVDIW